MRLQEQEQRIRHDERQHGAGQHHRLAPDPVRVVADDRRQHQVDQAGQRGGPQCIAQIDLQRLRREARQEHQEYVVDDAADDRQSERREKHPAMRGEGFGQGHACDGFSRHGALERRRLCDARAQIVADGAKHETDQERNAPAPGEEVFGAEASLSGRRPRTLRTSRRSPSPPVASCRSGRAARRVHAPPETPPRRPIRHRWKSLAACGRSPAAPARAIQSRHRLESVPWRPLRPPSVRQSRPALFGARNDHRTSRLPSLPPGASGSRRRRSRNSQAGRRSGRSEGKNARPIATAKKP